MTDFIKNQAATEYVMGAIERAKLSHAYILCGQDDILLDIFADFFINAILCENSAENPPFCKKCSNCIKMKNKTHPDIMTLDNEGNIKIEQIRAITRDIHILPNEAQKKLYVIKNAQNMTTSAQNSLLKALEEPTGHVVFLLLADSKSSLLPTVCSRSIILQMSPLPQQEILHYLKKSMPETAQENISCAAKVADGSISAAISFLESLDNETLTTVKAMLNCLNNRSKYGYVRQCQKLQKSRDFFINTIKIFTAILYQIVILRKNIFDDVSCDAITNKHAYRLFVEANTAISAINANASLKLTAINFLCRSLDEWA